jgi:hypothetical protein
MSYANLAKELFGISNNPSQASQSKTCTSKTGSCKDAKCGNSEGKFIPQKNQWTFNSKPKSNKAPALGAGNIIVNLNILPC